MLNHHTVTVPPVAELKVETQQWRKSLKPLRRRTLFLQPPPPLPPVLGIKSNEGMKRSVRQTKSREMTKTKQKKIKQKIDAKKPKKPPTAFFYFL
ncbi:hypothetical protein P8452_38782 [Trifolium repens]|nr:hypothetical protein P8452_38782 [Trifolium repens]